MSYELGEKIRNIRNELGLTLNEFGNLIDKDVPLKKIKSGTVSNWEQGLNKPNSRRLKRIAEISGITVEELLKHEHKVCCGCAYDLIKTDYNFCPLCGMKL